ncbi:unnamed protein product, partial [Prorocentrum cordatum]
PRHLRGAGPRAAAAAARGRAHMRLRAVSLPLAAGASVCLLAWNLLDPSPEDAFVAPEGGAARSVHRQCRRTDDSGPGPVAGAVPAVLSAAAARPGAPAHFSVTLQANGGAQRFRRQGASPEGWRGASGLMPGGQLQQLRRRGGRGLLPRVRDVRYLRRHPQGSLRGRAVRRAHRAASRPCALPERDPPERPS